MPIKLKIQLSKGWKASENDRFGEILEVHFIDVKTDKVLFKYAPKYDDKDIWGKVFTILLEYDDKLVQLRAVEHKIRNLNEFLSSGKGEKESCI